MLRAEPDQTYMGAATALIELETAVNGLTETLAEVYSAFTTVLGPEIPTETTDSMRRPGRSPLAERIITLHIQVSAHNEHLGDLMRRADL